VRDHGSDDSFKYEWIANGVNLGAVFASGAGWTGHDHGERWYEWVS
jgi:hypothetical protein